MTSTEVYAVATAVAAIERDGYVVLEDAIEPELRTQLRDTLRRLEAELGVTPRGEVVSGQRMAEVAYRDAETRRQS